MTNQTILNIQNANFWDELCGSTLARSLGITETTTESLERFDRAYFDYYPYLAEYVLGEKLPDKRVLEIGLGYGTLGNLIALQNTEYFGLDIAWKPTKMMQYRLHFVGLEHSSLCGQGSVLALPLRTNYFDYVYTIGCLHHTGNLRLAIQEIYRSSSQVER